MSASVRMAVLPACLLAALASLSARAQSVESPGGAIAELDTVEVIGQRPDGYAAVPSTGPTRLELSARETPQSISVVTREQMDHFGLNSINQVLGLATGINVEQVESDRNYYTARGFDITNFQRDGLGLPLPYGIQNGDIDTALYERIEILRGANGLMSSTGNPSATINFVRKRPGPDREGSARVTLASWDNARVDLDYATPITADGRVRGRVVAAWQDGDSYLDRYSREKQVYYGVIEADLGEATTIAVGASHQRNRPEGVLWGALPLFHTDGTPTDYDVSTSTAADWSHWYTDDTRAFVELSHALGGDWTLKAAYNFEDKQEDSQLFYVYGTPDPDTGLGLFAYPSDYEGRFKARFADVYASGRVSIGGRAHDVVVGANWARGENTEISWYGNDVGTPLPSLDQFDGNYPKPSFDAYSDGAAYDYGRESLYATVRWNLADHFKLITGANHTRVDTRGYSYGEQNTVDESRTTPFAGAVLDLGDTYSVYASYGEIFSQQGQTDVDNRLVGALEGRNAELGLKGEWFGGDLNASAAVFRTEQDNLAEYAGFDPATGRSYYAGLDARSQGVEFDVGGRIGDHWQLNGGYTLLDVEDAAGADARSYVPRRLLRLSTAVELPQVPGLSLGATLKWQSDIHRDAVAYDALGNATPVRIEQEAYALLGLMARYEFAQAWSATLNLDNVTDEKYLPSLYWEQGYYAAPRSASLSIAYRF
ncbi:TonB-dependent siderophore receptor [Arenimonas terrae]|uniref:TonB-dependent siderophore receptor n=1 Tax=Arenimonas terrae TaxID=2546226 RepID=A0A5C4RXJ2_9GAMM|nr:TonB-dependent siderophore receptor [Arenimonas terrae]TNJ35688.1 TonB-dependent siderophore receptor [Arenimonas terrae]